MTQYKTNNKVSEVMQNTNSLLSNLNSLTGNDVNIPNYDFEGLGDKYKGNFYGELNYSDNLKHDNAILAKVGINYNF